MEEYLLDKFEIYHLANRSYRGPFDKFYIFDREILCLIFALFFE